MATEEELTCDVAIVGGGLVGAATAWQLSKLAPGVRGVIIERSNVGHVQGGSAGISRMWRELHSDPFYVSMQRATFELWRELEGEAGEQLLSESPLWFLGDTGTGETVEGQLLGCFEAAREQGIPHRLTRGKAQLERELPLIAEEGWEGVVSERAGVVRAARVLATLRRAVVRRGWTLLEGTQVTSMDLEAASKELRVERVGGAERARDGAGGGSAGGRRGEGPAAVRARRVVLATGAWTLQTLGLAGRTLGLEAWRMHWGHVDVADEAARRAHPLWYLFSRPFPGEPEDGGLYYGFPAEEGTREVKVGLDFAPGAACRAPYPPSSWFDGPDPSVRAMFQSFVAKHMPAASGPVRLGCNPYSMSPDGDFVLGSLPDIPGVALFAGDSGRAFKFGPLLGRLLAEVTLGRERTTFPCARFSVSRPSLGYRRSEGPHDLGSLRANPAPREGTAGRLDDAPVTSKL